MAPQTKPSRRVLKGGRNLYKRGYALEMRVKAKLVTLGWSVTRAGGSHGTDLVAARKPGDPVKAGPPQADYWPFVPGRLVYIAVKRTGEIPPHERLDLAAEAKKAGAECYVIRADYSAREVSEWTVSDWQDLSEVF